MSPVAMRAATLALCGAILSGCASSDLVVVVPEKNGHVGAVVVNPGDSQTVLDKAYASAHPRSGRNPAFTSDASQVSREFAPALAALPEEPAVYRLNFEFDSDHMTPESRAAFDGVFTEIKRRPAPELVVTGHTDAVGSADYNDKLSLDRAEAIKELLVSRGVARDSITVAGRGSRAPLYHAAEGVAEPRNRRVEITVR
jgi:outer membrane protein OmpA-like peptidoglycan-associated protein